MVLIGIFFFFFFVYFYVVPTLVNHFQRIECGFASFHSSDYFHKSDSVTKHTYLFIIFFLSVIFFRRMVFKDRKRENISWKNFIENSAYFSNYQKINSARTSRTLASLISSGVNVGKRFLSPEMSFQNNKYKEVLTRAIDDVQKGVPVSNSFKETVINLPPFFWGK